MRDAQGGLDEEAMNAALCLCRAEWGTKTYPLFLAVRGRERVERPCLASAVSCVLLRMPNKTSP